MTRRAVTIVPPEAPIRGRVAPPGSKSITNRALLLAAMAPGVSRLTGVLKSDDTRLMVTALRQMGVVIGEPDDTRFEVRSNGRLSAPAEPLFLGNAGTATRFLTAMAATVTGTVTIDGDDHMRKRPIAPLIDALRAAGVAAAAPTGCPPLTVRGTGRFAATRIEVDASLSSQYVSAVLMVAAMSETPVEVVLAGEDVGAVGYIDLTVAAMRSFGGSVEHPKPSTWVVAPTGYRAAQFHVEPDASAATYLWAAEALTGGAIDIGTPPGAFTQPDARAKAFIDAFPAMPLSIDGSQMQDAVPTLAVLAAFNSSPVRFTDIANLRVKECDRIRALANELNRIRPGLAVEGHDELVVASDPSMAGETLLTDIVTYSDHRIAMSFALAGLRIGGITITDAGCVAKTYPGYWDALASLGVKLHIREQGGG